jgi:hypothetical protein
MSDTHMTEVMGGKNQLVPEEAKEDCTRHKPIVAIGICGCGSQKRVTYYFRAVPSQVRCFIKSSIDDALVKGSVGLGMTSLNLGRKIWCGGLERRQGGGRIM